MCLFGSIGVGGWFALGTLGLADSEVARDREQQQIIRESERQLEIDAAGVESQAQLSRVYQDNRVPEYKTLIIRGYQCGDGQPPIDVKARSQYEKPVKVYDQNNVWLGDLKPLKNYPSGNFQVRRECLINGSS